MVGNQKRCGGSFRTRLLDIRTRGLWAPAIVSVAHYNRRARFYGTLHQHLGVYATRTGMDGLLDAANASSRASFTSTRDVSMSSKSLVSR